MPFVLANALPEQSVLANTLDSFQSTQNGTTTSTSSTYSNEWIKGQWYAKDGSTSYTYQGSWKKNSKGWWYEDENGWYPKNCWQKISGKMYFFHDDGVMHTGWLEDGGSWYYLENSGTLMTGWMKDGGKWYYFGSSGAMATGWQKVGGHWYHFKSSGAMNTGWFEDKEAENRLPAGQKRAIWYWFDNDGAMATGWKEISGQWEMFADSGEWLYTWQGN